MSDEPGLVPTARSKLIFEARALVTRAVQVIDESKKQRRRGLHSSSATLEHVTWSDHLIGESRLVMDRLHDAVTIVAASERDNGAPPERVITLLKGLVVDAKADKLDPPDARTFLEDMVRWAIEGYYAD